MATVNDNDLVEAIQKATSVVDSSNVSENLRPVAFKVVLQALVGIGGIEVRGATPPAAGSTEMTTPIDDGGALEKIAEKAGKNLERIKEIYKEEPDGGLSLVIGHGKIDSSDAGGSRELTLLIAGGRQAAGLEEWTPLEVARETCRHYARFDSSNYASTIKSEGNNYAFSGSGSNRKVRVTMPGWEEWASLIDRLLSSED